MICPNCGFENKDGSKFCNECGQPLVSLSSTIPSISSEVTADLSGLERMVDSSYQPPVASWRTGNTAELPRLSDEQYASGRSFQAPDDLEPRRAALGGKVFGILVAFIVVVALAVFATYKMELWGGKTIPNVVGYSQADAIYLLEAKGFEVRATQVKSDDVEGIVLLMDPSAESRLEVGTEVVVHVSTARFIPEIVGIPRLNASHLLKEEGFTNIQFVEVKSNDHEGKILSVSPEVGTKAKAGTPIIIEVTVPFTVPDVANMSQDQARLELEKEGYIVEVAWDYSEDVPEGMALRTDPAAGSELAAGSSVALVVSKSRALELINASRSYFGSQDLFVIGGVTYQIDHDTLEVTFVDAHTVHYRMDARQVESHYWEVEDRWETKYGKTSTIEGKLFWDDATSVQGGDPTIYRAE